MTRADIKKNRGPIAKPDHVGAVKWEVAAAVCPATGLRKAAILRLCPQDLGEVNGRLEIFSRSKGGRRDWLLVHPDYADFIRALFQASPGFAAGGETRIFPQNFLPKRINVQVFRRAYAKLMYLHFAELGLGSGETYQCRKELAGIVYDRGILLRVSRNLQHERVDVAVNDYLSPQAGEGHILETGQCWRLPAPVDPRQWTFLMPREPSPRDKRFFYDHMPPDHTPFFRWVTADGGSFAGVTNRGEVLTGSWKEAAHSTLGQQVGLEDRPWENRRLSPELLKKEGGLLSRETVFHQDFAAGKVLPLSETALDGWYSWDGLGEEPCYCIPYCGHTCVLPCALLVQLFSLGSPALGELLGWGGSLEELVDGLQKKGDRLHIAFSEDLAKTHLRDDLVRAAAWYSETPEARQAWDVVSQGTASWNWDGVRLPAIPGARVQLLGLLSPDSKIFLVIRARFVRLSTPSNLSFSHPKLQRPQGAPSLKGKEGEEECPLEAGEGERAVGENPLPQAEEEPIFVPGGPPQPCFAPPEGPGWKKLRLAGMPRPVDIAAVIPKSVPFPIPPRGAERFQEMLLTLRHRGVEVELQYLEIHRPGGGIWICGIATLTMLRGKLWVIEVVGDRPGFSTLVIPKETDCVSLVRQLIAQAVSNGRGGWDLARLEALNAAMGLGIRRIPHRPNRTASRWARLIQKRG